MAEIAQGSRRNWTSTRVTEVLDIQYPIFQGPFGRGGSAPELTAAVSNGGGLGAFGANDLDAADILQVGKKIRALTDRPFGMNLWVSTSDAGGAAIDQHTYDLVMEALKPYYIELRVAPNEIPRNQPKNFEKQFEALLEVKPALFSFVFGIPGPEMMSECKRLKIVTAGAATTVDEAIALQAAGVDIVVAAGFEGGGHRPSFLKPTEDSLIGTIALVPQCVDAIDIPVIAAGGIADGRGVAAAFKLGAEAVQIGTAFLACEESGASDYHRELLFSRSAYETGLSRAFTGRLARGLYNRFAKELKPLEANLAKYPAQTWLVAPLKEAAIKQGRYDLIALWAGQAAPLLKHNKAAELLASLVSETDALLPANECLVAPCRGAIRRRFVRPS